MSEIGLVEEFNEAVGDVSLLWADASHVCDKNGFEVLADRPEVGIAHHCFHQLREVVETY